jgi:hypothetical protein
MAQHIDIIMDSITMEPWLLDKPSWATFDAHMLNVETINEWLHSHTESGIFPDVEFDTCAIITDCIPAYWFRNKFRRALSDFASRGNVALAFVLPLEYSRQTALWTAYSGFLTGDAWLEKDASCGRTNWNNPNLNAIKWCSVGNVNWLLSVDPNKITANAVVFDDGYELEETMSDSELRDIMICFSKSEEYRQIMMAHWFAKVHKGRAMDVPSMREIQESLFSGRYDGDTMDLVELLSSGMFELACEVSPRHVKMKESWHEVALNSHGARWASFALAEIERRGAKCQS